jgi:hypothetical protein
VNSYTTFDFSNLSVSAFARKQNTLLTLTALSETLTLKFGSICDILRVYLHIRYFIRGDEYSKHTLRLIGFLTGFYYELMPYFFFKFISIKSTKITLQNSHLNFSRYMLFEKSYDIFRDFRSKLFGNILKIFPISSSKFFKLIYLKSSAEIY